MNCEDKNDFCTKVLEMYQQGFSCKDIAAVCGVPTLRVRDFLRDKGFNTRSYRKVSVSNSDKVLLLIKNNYPYIEIERLMHVSTHVIREIVQNNGLVGFAPRYHHPHELNIEEKDVSFARLNKFRGLYLSGKHGLGLCVEKTGISDDELLWFVYHLNEEDMQLHHKNLAENIREMVRRDVPVTAVAKSMDISPAIVKKILKEPQ